MASLEAASYLSEWEVVERDWEESDVNSRDGEEAEMSPTVNKHAWENSCNKLEANSKYHQRYISVADALSFRKLSTFQQETFIKDRELSLEDGAFLISDVGVKCVKDASNAVVCITVRLVSRMAQGTGFFVKVNNKIAVITNSHSVRSSASEGVDFRLVRP